MPCAAATQLSSQGLSCGRSEQNLASGEGTKAAGLAKVLLVQAPYVRLSSEMSFWLHWAGPLFGAPYEIAALFFSTV